MIKDRCCILEIFYLQFSTGVSYIAARPELKLRCPDDIDRLSDRRSATAVISWSKRNFRIRSTNRIKYVTSRCFL